MKDEGLSVSKTGAMRFNKGKPRMSLTPGCLVAAVAEVFWANADVNGGKYPMHNWRKGLPLSEILDAILRHAFRIADGEFFDNGPEGSGLPHIYHIATNCAIFIWTMQRYPELNDLYKKEGGSDASDS